MRKWIQSIAIMLSVISIFALSSQVVRAEDPPGAKAYATYCSACHGAGGNGGAAPAIGSAQYLSAKDDAVIMRITSDGVAGKGMPAWSKSKGGVLTDDQIASIVAYLRSPATSASAAPAASSAFLVETRLFLTQSADTNGLTTLSVLLQEYNGYPVVGAPVELSRERTRSGRTRAVVVNSGCSNVAMGERGIDHGPRDENAGHQKPRDDAGHLGKLFNEVDLPENPVRHVDVVVS